MPELKEGDFVQLQNLRGRNPLKSDYNGIVVGKRNLNSYAVKINGTGRVTVRNRATLRKILPPVPIHKLASVQGPVMSGPSAEPAGSGRQAGPLGCVQRAGLRSGVMNGNNIVVSGDSADGAIVQKELESCELVLRAAADMDNPGILKVLRSSGAVLAPVQSNGEPAPGAELAHGQSGGQAGSLEQGSGAGGDSPGRGGLRQVGSQDR